MTHAHADTGAAWWRPVQVQAVAPGHVADAHSPTSRVAFGALVAFTAILLLSPHPGQVKAEINSVPRGQENSNEAAALGREIHEMLFADQIEEAPNASGD